MSSPSVTVAIPVCNRTKFLPQCLDSVFCQKDSALPDEILIVDNSTDEIDWSKVLPQYLNRITILRQPKHLTLYENWNSCILNAKGDLVHILHDDDWLLSGFYECIRQMASAYPGFGLYATRVHVVSENGLVEYSSPSMPLLRANPRCAAELYCTNHFQCSAVVLRKSLLIEQDMFRLDLPHCADWEMWIRVIRNFGGVLSDDALACYRVYGEMVSARQKRDTTNLLDYERLAAILWDFPDFPRAEFRQNLLRTALQQHETFLALRDIEAAKKNLSFWRSRASVKMRVIRVLRTARNYIRSR